MQIFNMKQMKGNTKLWIFMATCLWSTVLMFSTEARNIDSFPIDQTGRDMIIRSVVPKNDDVSSAAEVTQQIVGINNMCVDVFLGLYFDGNTIQLYPCKSNGEVNQQWTWEKNKGTIQSNGKCLATKGKRPGSYVIISDCNNVEAKARVWEVQEDGSILNPSSSLVLTSKSGESGTQLTVETNVYALGQGWHFTNDSTPLPKSIVEGFLDYCLEANNEILWAADCMEMKTEQKWNFYADGSIRLDAKKDLCITSKGNIVGSFVLVLPCSPVSSNQRWMVGKRYAITYFTLLNVNNGLAIDVKNSPPNLLHIVLSESSRGGLWYLSP